MNRRRIARFLASYILVGITVAVAVVVIAPELLRDPRPVVEIQRSSPPAAEAAGRGRRGPVSYADAVARAAPAIVNVYTAKTTAPLSDPLFGGPLLRRFFGELAPAPPAETSLGSGVIVSPRGYVLTNNHVVAAASRIEVLLADGRASGASLVGTDPESDLAVLKIGLDDLPNITVGDSEALRVGDVVLAIGNPFGVGQTVTQGIVSATGRSQLGLTTFEDFIQTDAAVNPGNSGGALIDAHGKLVGISTAIYSRSGGSMGIGFAIPVSLAQGVLRQIIERGRVVRGWIGIQIQQASRQRAATADLDAARGVVVEAVVGGGPADQAGLRAGDLVVSVNGRKATSTDTVLNQVTALKPGQQLRLSGRRNGERFERQVTVAERPTGRSNRTPLPAPRPDG